MLSSSDEILIKMFNNLCMEVLNFFKKVYDEKLVSVVIILISFGFNFCIVVIMK